MCVLLIASRTLGAVGLVEVCVSCWITSASLGNFVSNISANSSNAFICFLVLILSSPFYFFIDVTNYCAALIASSIGDSIGNLQ